jgi:GT2 family glycosyltransferase
MNLEQGIVFANKLLLVGWGNDVQPIAEVRLSDAAGEGVRIQAPPALVVRRRGRAKENAKNPVAMNGVVIPIALSELLTLDFEIGPWSVAVHFENGDEVHNPVLRVGPIDLKGEAGETGRALLEFAVKSGVYDATVGRLFDPSTEWLPNLAGLTIHLDHQLRSKTGQFLIGWIANLGSRRLTFLSDDLISMSSAAETVCLSRPDVSSYLRGTGAIVGTDLHGFYVSLQKTVVASRRLLVLEETDAGAVVHGPIELAPTRNDDVAFGALRALNRGTRWARPEVAEWFFAPFLRERRAQDESFAVEVLHEGNGEPRASIIVPFYKEARFIRSIVAMQLLLSPHFEWVLVCDDPSIAGQIETYLSGRKSSLRHRTVFVRNQANYGFSTANNIGIRNASAPIIVLMNSDIWVEDPAPLELAIDSVLDGAYDLVGTRLLYEDRTIQHNEIEFERSPVTGNLYIATHPLKGLPASDGELRVEPATAVTGALVVMSRDGYERWGGLSEEFIRGDFEDTDLCLRILHGGGRVGIVRANGIFHLERQSISLMAGESIRSAVTYLNCIQFNRRWSDFLERMESAASAET